MPDPEGGTAHDGGIDRSTAPDTAVEFTSELSPMLLAQVLTAGTIASPLVLTIVLAGPMFLALGALTSGAMLTQWGYTFLVALPVVPLLSFAMAYINSHRKASADVLRPVHVCADAAGLELEMGEETRAAGWSEFRRWRRLVGTHLLYTSPKTFIILHADELDDAGRVAFEALLRAHIPEGPRR